MKFVPKAEAVEAKQFRETDVKKPLPRVSSTVDGRVVVRFRLPDGQFVKDGDYLIKTKEGVQAMDQADFEALYRPEK